MKCTKPSTTRSTSEELCLTSDPVDIRSKLIASFKDILVQYVFICMKMTGKKRSNLTERSATGHYCSSSPGKASKEVRSRRVFWWKWMTPDTTAPPKLGTWGCNG